MLFNLLRKGYGPAEIAFILILYILALSIAFAGHEFAHAFSAHLMGDDTAKNRGRMTLNPVAHVDIKGIIILILVGLGWGKPVPVNPSNYTKLKSRTLSCIIVDLSGVFSNFIMAFIAAILMVVVERFANFEVMWWILIEEFLDLLYMINISLMAFNLLPIPPLDGFNALFTILPVRVKYTNFYRKYVQIAPLVLLGAILLGAATNIQVFGFILDIIASPFEKIIFFACTWLSKLL